MSFIRKISARDVESMNHLEVDMSNNDGTTDCYQGWESCDQYAYEVLSKNGKYYKSTGLQTKNACARYVYDRTKREDIEFRKSEVDDVIKFAGKFKHTKGGAAGKRIELLMWMIFVVGNLFGWYYTSGERKGRRRFTKAFTLVARGNAKSFLCSIIALYTLLISPNGSPSCYVVARNKEQAGIVFNDAKKLLKTASATLRKYYNMMAPKLESFLLDGLLQPMAADGQSVDGHRVTLGICDELHAHHDSSLLNTLNTGTTATTDPLVFCISTAGIQLDGVCINERNLVRDINSDLEKLDEYFGIEFSIDEKDDWKDSSNWAKANPSLGYAIQLFSLRAEFARALQSAVNRKDFLTKYCNVFVNTNDSPYLDLLQMQEQCSRENFSMKDFLGRECYIGLDLAQKIDLASLTVLFPEDDGGVSVFHKHFLPQTALDAATPSRYDAYVRWEDAGLLHVTEGASTDYTFIREEILWVAKHFNLIMVGYDPYSATQFAIDMEKDDIEMVEVKQGISHLSEPAKMTQALIAEGKLNYSDEDRMFEWCCANAVCFKDINENLKVVKDKTKPHDKIDSIISTIIGMQLVELKEPKPKSPYKTRGLITT